MPNALYNANDDSRNALYDGTDPFEAAAYRVKRSVKPSPLRDPVQGQEHQDVVANNLMDFLVSLAGSKGIGAAVQAAPRAAALLGGAALTASPVAAGDPTGKEWWRTPREPFSEPAKPEIGAFVEPALSPDESERFGKTPPGFDKLGPRGRASAVGKQQEDQRAALDAKIARARSDFEASRNRNLADYDADLSRRRAEYEAQQSQLDARDLEYKKANQSFAETYPAETAMLPYAGAAFGGALARAGRAGMAARNKNLVGQMEDAISGGQQAAALPGRSAATVARREGALNELQSASGAGGVGRMLPDSPGPLSTPWNVGVAGAMGGGAEGSVLPYQIDQSTLPLGSHGREEADNRINWLYKMTGGVLPGLLAGSAAMSIPLRGGSVVAPVSRMEGVIAELEALKAADAAKAAGKPVPKKAKPRVRNELMLDNDVMPYSPPNRLMGPAL